MFGSYQPSIVKGDMALSNPLLKSSQGGYFGPGNAQLPASPMLMMDRIIEISMDGGEFGKGHVIGELDITPDLWFLTVTFSATQ
jgi:3-hydroxyacyl-[acyl-carrier protein] dehydratase / trans-2-decenoyl-[acyl-carrier protein] isomerase